VHRKYRGEITLRPIWRIFLSANDDPDSAFILPGLGSLADKVIYLKCWKPPTPFPTVGSEEAAAFWKTLVDAIPAFVAELDDFEIPKELWNSRFGVAEYHHPEIVDLIKSLSGEDELGDVLDSWLQTQLNPEIRKCAVDLYADLDDFTHGISRFTKHLGHQLHRLSSEEGWRGRIRRTRRRRSMGLGRCLLIKLAPQLSSPDVSGHRQ